MADVANPCGVTDGAVWLLGPILRSARFTNLGRFQDQIRPSGDLAVTKHNLNRPFSRPDALLQGEFGFNPHTAGLSQPQCELRI